MRVITIGNFDGIHPGHKKLIGETINTAEKYGLESCLLTFERIFSIPDGQMLTTLDEKIEYLSSLNLGRIVILPNKVWLWNMTPEKFIKSVLLDLKARFIVLGYNFKFGKNASGSAGLMEEEIKRYGVKVKIIPPVMRDEKIISSSIIRNLLLSGEIEKANNFLGRFYSITGNEVRGKQIARKLGFPTINLRVNEEKLLPGGIFYGIASNKKDHKCLIYIGTSPTTTIKKGGGVEVEFHIIDGQNFPEAGLWRLYLISKMRSEKKFMSRADLKKQIKKDIIMARAL